MWGIVPAAGSGSRIQPLAFSKELLPVGSRFDNGVERPRAVSEYLVERMVLGGVTKLCFVIAPGKSDIMEYYGRNFSSAHICYAVQPYPAGLCDALFQAVPFIGPGEDVIIGLPDTIWYPENALAALEDGAFSFLLFPVEHPEFFDAVVTGEGGYVQEVRVKSTDPGSSWIWGAFKMPAEVLQDLFSLWCERNRGDEYFGTLVNAYLARGNRAKAVRAGLAYTDVGTLHGYREAVRLTESAEKR